MHRAAAASGFVLSLIYGLGAHMLPRFTGNPIAVGVLTWLQYGCINAGIVLFTGGHWLAARFVAITGGALMWTSLLIFALRVWPVLWHDAGKDRRAKISVAVAQ